MADIEKQILYSVPVSLDGSKKLKQALNDASEKILDYKPGSGRMAELTVTITGVEKDS
ncbi:hypothetical protein [Sulfuricurvum sp.]|uniref:hypothetical protein n=1 Tax=Sulfuricurvum sp. TaxID=2025608 RepID=UPI00356470D0